MTRTRNGTIYALVDPRDNKIRYIGKTEKPVLVRLAGHLATPTNPAMRVWINALGLQGLTPRIEPVITVPVGQLATEEQRQIRQHAEQGHRLLNAPHYHQHLADLGQRAAAPAQGHPVPGRKLAQWAYGPLAKARASNRVPAWAAAVIVTAGAPLFAAGLLLRAVLHSLLHTLPGNWLAALSAGGWIFWEAGFDAAVREVLLPRLPVAQWAAFWDGYMAGPLVELAVSFLWPAFVVSVLLAGMAYGEVAKKAGVQQRR